MNRILTVIFMLSLVLSGCNKGPGGAEDAFKVYYPSKDGVRVSSVGIQVGSYDTDALIGEAMAMLAKQPSDYDLRPAIPEDVTVLSLTLNDGLLLVDFSTEYYKITGREEIIRRAAIVRTLDQIEGVDEISFTVDGSPITDSKDVPIGIMTADMFIDNAGDEINSYERAKLLLYYANAEGTGLVRTTENVAYNSNISLEKLVCEHLISGPLAYGAYPVTDPGVHLMAVTTKDGVCYVNLSKEFLVKQGNLTDEVVLYSFVNSLTELSNVNKVQFMIDSETEISFGEHSYLNTPFERDLELIEVR
ncbi:MAG: GerMN domain-containing protein [Lachnospiraceae bacterium]|nr:GerMN domain-containing protein [Lachnospiraceae bacterium]